MGKNADTKSNGEKVLNVLTGVTRKALTAAVRRAGKMHQESGAAYDAAASLFIDTHVKAGLKYADLVRTVNAVVKSVYEKDESMLNTVRTGINRHVRRQLDSSEGSALAKKLSYETPVARTRTDRIEKVLSGKKPEKVAKVIEDAAGILNDLVGVFSGKSDALKVGLSRNSDFRHAVQTMHRAMELFTEQFPVAKAEAKAETAKPKAKAKAKAKKAKVA